MVDSPSRTLTDRTPAERLLDRHRSHDEPYDVEIEDVRLRMRPGVFCPAFTNTSLFLARHIQVYEGERVLDLFAGSGFQGIAVAPRAGSVVCADHSAEAVACAAENAALNGVADRVEVRHGDLFEPVRAETFDVVIANPPLIPGEPEDVLETAVYDRSMTVSRRFLAEVGSHLTGTGRVYLIFSDLPGRLGVFDLERSCAEAGLGCELLGERPVGYETYSVYLLRKL